MSLSLTPQSIEHFTFSLLKHNHQARSGFYYLLSSQTLILNLKVKEILTLHTSSCFGECYSMIIRSVNEINKAFLSKLSSYLLSLEEYSIQETIHSLNNDYGTALKSRIDFYNVSHRKAIYDYFNIPKPVSSLGLSSELILSNIINLLEYYEIIKQSNESLNNCLSNLIGSMTNDLGVSPEEKNQKCYVNNIKSFFESNTLNMKYNPSKTNNTSNPYQSYVLQASSFKSEEDKELNEKLNYIYESINNITFDSHDPLAHSTSNDPLINTNPISNSKNQNIINQSSSSLVYNNNNDISRDHFIDKLKIFTVLKKNAIYRKQNHAYYQKRDKLKLMAKFFYHNLLRSRTFFGFAKLLKQKTYYNILKNNYIDYRIGELSHYLIQSLLYCCNRAKVVHGMRRQHDIQIKKKVFNYFYEKLQYKTSYNQFYISKIINNEYALKFMLDVCSVANGQVESKPKFEGIYRKMLLMNELHEKRRLFHLAIQAMKSQQQNNEGVYMRFKEIMVVIDFNCFVAKTKQRIKYKRLKAAYMQKLFFMRYYVRYYQNQHDKDILIRKYQEVIRNVVIKRNFSRFKQTILSKRQHKNKMNQIVMQNPKDKQAKISNDIRPSQNYYNKIDPTAVNTINSINDLIQSTPLPINTQTMDNNIESQSLINNSNSISLQDSFKHNSQYAFYYNKLKRKIMRVLLSYHLMQQKIFIVKEIGIKRAYGSFFKIMKIKTIKGLINQGIVEKIRQYKNVLMLQILFSSYFSKLKLTKGNQIRQKYLMKTALHFLSMNVRNNYKEIHLKMKYYVRLFLKKAVLLSSQKTQSKTINSDRVKQINHKLFFDIVKYRRDYKLNIKKLQLDFLQQRKKNDIKAFLYNKNHSLSSSSRHSNKQKDNKYRRIYGKSFFKMITKNLIINKQKEIMKRSQMKRHLKEFNSKIQRTIMHNMIGIMQYKHVLRIGMHQLIKGIKRKETINSKASELDGIIRKYYSEIFFNGFFISARIKSITSSVNLIYQNKVKEKIFQVYKKRYLSKIKSSMLSCRYREYLLISSLSKLITKLQKNQSNPNN